MSGFYKTHSKILTLDPYKAKDLELIQFNNYLCRKENLQRLSDDLEKGYFKISYTVIGKETGLTRGKIQNLIRWFEAENIITCIEKSTKKGSASVYAYTVYLDENSNTNFDTNCDTDLSSISNGSESVDDTNCNTNSNTYKKELLKRVIKKDKDIYKNLSFLDLENVKVTEEQYAKLIELVNGNKNIVHDKMLSLEIGIVNKNKKYLGYKNHYLTLRKWLSMEVNKKTPTAIGADTNKKTNYNSSICKTNKNIPKVQEIDLFS